MHRQFILLAIGIFYAFGLMGQGTSFWPEKPMTIPELEVEIFTLDKSHSKLTFSIGYFGFSDVEGTFDRYSATVLYNENDLTKMSIALVVDASTINTGSDFRDKDLKGEKFFDTDKHRTLQFFSKRIEKKGKKYWAIGDLTIKGITKEIRVPFEQTQKKFIDPFWSNMNIGFKGEITLNRIDFDVHGGSWGEKVLSEEVKIEFAMVAKQSNTYKWGDSETGAKVDQIVKAMKTEGIEEAKKRYRAVAREIEMDAFKTGLVAKRLLQKNHFEAAIGYLEFALEQFPNQRGYYKDLARAYAYLGQQEKARELYGQIKARNPFDTEAAEMLRRLK